MSMQQIERKYGEGVEYVLTSAEYDSNYEGMEELPAEERYSAKCVVVHERHDAFHFCDGRQDAYIWLQDEQLDDLYALLQAREKSKLVRRDALAQTNEVGQLDKAGQSAV